MANLELVGRSAGWMDSCSVFGWLGGWLSVFANNPLFSGTSVRIFSSGLD